MKKNLFRILFAALAVTFASSFVGCSADDETEVIPVLKVKTADTEFNGAGGEGTIVLNCNLSDAEATTTAEWITITENYYSADKATLTVSYEVAGNTGAERTATIQVLSQSTGYKDEVTVQQSAITLSAVIDKTEFTAVGGQGTITVAAEAGDAAVVTVAATEGEAAAEWIEFAEVTTYADLAEGLAFTVKENPGETRTAEIVLTVGGIASKPMTLTQTNMTLELTDAGTTSYTVNGGEGEITLTTTSSTVNASVNYNVEEAAPAEVSTEEESTEEWITLTEATPEKVSYTVAENLVGLARKAEIIIEAGEKGRLVVLVEQAAAQIEITEYQAAMPVAGGEASVIFTYTKAASAEVTAEVLFAEGEEQWLTITEKRTTEPTQGVLLIKAEPCSHKEGHAATIRVSVGEVSDEVTITQSGAELGSLALAQSEVTAAGGENTLTYTATAIDATKVTVSSDKEWVTFTTTETTVGESKEGIPFTVEPNMTTSAREATITITVGFITETITLQQEALMLTLSAESASYKGGGGNGSFTINTNAPTTSKLTVSTNAEWIKLGENATIESGVSYSIEQHLGDLRTGTITVQVGEATATYTVTQSGEAELSLANNNLTVDGESGMTATQYFTNITIADPVVTLPEDCTWLTAEVDTDQQSIIFKMSPHYYGTTRSVEYTVTLSGTSVTGTLSQTPDLEAELVDCTIVNARHLANDNVITVNATAKMINNISNWTATAAAGSEWITVTKQEHAFTVGVYAYDDPYNIRKGVVELKDAEGVVIRTVEVYQMNKLALAGNWAWYNTKGEYVASVAFTRDENAVTGNTSVDNMNNLELHDFIFWKADEQSANNQGWFDLNALDGSACLNLALSTRFNTFWTGRTSCFYNNIPYGTEGHENYVALSEVTSSVCTGDHQLLFTYAGTNDSGQSVIKVNGDEQVKALGLTGIAWLFTDNDLNVTGACGGYYPDVIGGTLVRTYIPTEEQLTYKGALGNRNLNVGADTSEWAEVDANGNPIVVWF